MKDSNVKSNVNEGIYEGDKLEFLFKKQIMLFSEELIPENKKSIPSSSPENSSTSNPIIKEEEAIASTSTTLPAKNKMKKLYEIEEPFDGYRIFMIASALLHETVELQRETNWKWWKKSKEIDIENIQEEIIDIWHFLIQLSIEAGLDPDKLISKYIDKNKENSSRQLRGY